MNILALMPDAYSGRGGIAQYNRDILDALAGMAEVEKVVSVPRLSSESACDLPVKLVERSAGRSVTSYVRRAMFLAFETRPDAVLCGHLNLLPVAAAASRALGARLIVELYGIEAWSRRKTRAYEWSIEQIDLAIAISRFTRAEFLRWARIDPVKVRVVPNAIHLDRYSPSGSTDYLRSRYELGGSRVLLTLGRLSAAERYKGQDRMIRILPDVLREHPNVIYVIAGDGDDRRRLEALAVDCGVATHVRFTGRIPDEDMADLYNLADAFAMPSTGEGFGFVFLEAAACAVPVLGGSVDGSRDALADGRIGIMVDPDNRESLYAGVLKVLDTPKAVPSALSPYDFRHFERQVTGLIRATFVGGREWAA